MDTKITLKKELGKILQSTPAGRARAIIDSDHTREILEDLSARLVELLFELRAAARELGGERGVEGRERAFASLSATARWTTLEPTLRVRSSIG